MSFSKDAKLQILNEPVENDCCMLAFFSALLHSGGELIVKNGKSRVTILTDVQELIDYTNAMLVKLYGKKADWEIDTEYKINKSPYYRIIFPEDKTDQMLKDFGFLNNNYELVWDVDFNLIQSECCKRSFIKGAFLGCATSNIKINQEDRTTSGYQIEFDSHNKDFLENLAKILKNYEIYPKISERKNLYILYLKEASQVSDLLALVGASDSVLILQSELALRELRNKVNRQTNCESANISKTVNASLRQLEAIDMINNRIGIESLPEDLQEVAVLRLANPEESLEQLLKLSEIELTKSGLNHRFRKILKIAEGLID